jgi:prokaryotic ubiquitin-like protein Pup
MAREGGQQHKTSKKSTEDDLPPDAAPADEVAERKGKLDDDVDAILDDIDGVLESNAEEFVRGFVQKGGE